MGTQNYTDGVTLTAAAEFNRFDTAAYPVFSGVTGTSNISATGPANYTYSSTNPIFILTPAFTNVSTANLNVTPTGAAALGAKNIFFGGAACVGGELVAGVPAAVAYDGTQFNIVGGSGAPTGTTFQNSLGSDVALNNTANFFDGPTVAQGSIGRWLVTGSVTCVDNNGAASFAAKLWDGTNIIASGNLITSSINVSGVISLSGVITSPAGNLRISVKDGTSTGGKIIFNNTGASKDSTITAVRIG